MSLPLPLLYSFRRCPYAIRARLAIAYAGVQVELREVVLKDKPPHMLQISPKGTVPVLQLLDGTVIDESEDIMRWALAQNDPKCWLPKNQALQAEISKLIHCNDYVFKAWLDKYKYSDRHPEHTQLYYREQAESFLQQLDALLCRNTHLLSEYISLADIAIFPFIRQFAFVDIGWFGQCRYPKLQQWLQQLLDSELFLSVMYKYPQWKPDGTGNIFPSR